MAINEEIYGNSTQWEDYWHGTCKMTSYSLWSTVRSGDWELNELIDNSVCYFGAVGNFYVANPIAFFKTDNERCPLYPEASIHNILFMLNRADKDGWAYDAGSVRGTNNKWSEWPNTTDMPNYYNAYSSQTLFNFKLNKLLFIPYVDVSTSNGIDASSDTYTLGDWIKNHSTDHPYLHRVYLNTYYNRGTLESPEWASAEVDASHYIWLNKNAEFSEEFYNRGDRNVLSSYSIGARADMRQHLVIMGLGKTSGKDSITDTIPFTSTPIGYDSDLTHYIYDDNDNPSYVRYCRRYSENLVKEIYSQIAFLGVFFLGEGDGSFDDIKLTSDRVYLGTIDKGYTYGDYTHGEENADQPQYKWTDTSESEYDPDKEPSFIDKNDYNTPMHFTYPYTASLNTLYVISKSLYNQYNLERLYTALWKVIDDNYETAYSYDMGAGHDDLWFGNTYSNFSLNNFFTMNPIDALVSIKLFPYDTSNDSATTTTVKLGQYNTTISAHVANTTKHIEDNTGLQIAPYFGDCWIDRLTEYTLYVPFCGTLRLDPNIYMGKTIYLDYLIDQVTGACTATVRTVAKGSGGQDIETHEDSISGIIAADIPITGLNQATLQSQLYNANQQLKAGLWQTAAGIGTGALQITSAIAGGNVIQGATAAIGGINNFIQNDIKNQTNEYNLHHTEVAPRTVGSASPLTGLCMQYQPVLLISKPTIPKGFKEAEYAKTKGYACLISGTIGSDNEGYCVVQNPILNINCTETEKEMIRSLLASGVYV